MSERTDYGTIADKIDYTKLEKKLDGLREHVTDFFVIVDFAVLTS